MQTNDNPRPVKTAETAFEVLERLKEGGPAGVTELAADLGRAKSTIHRHLATLERHGYVVRDGDDYTVGLRLLDFGVHARNAHPLFTVAQSKVDDLAAETEEKVWCITEEQGRSIHLYGASGKRSVQTHARVGKRGYLHQTAAGKAILASLPHERVDEILDVHGLPAQTPNTITDRDDLLAELDAVRDRGYAYNREESVAGLRAVGAPVTDDDGVAIGAISVSGPANRLKGQWFEAELPDLLMGATNEVEINLAFSG